MGEHRYHRARTLVAGVLLAALGLTLAIGGAYALSLRALEQSQARWCPVLAAVVRPPHPTAAERAGYQQIVKLRTEFGCGG